MIYMFFVQGVKWVSPKRKTVTVTAAHNDNLPNFLFLIGSYPTIPITGGWGRGPLEPFMVENHSSMRKAG